MSEGNGDKHPSAAPAPAEHESPYRRRYPTLPELPEEPTWKDLAVAWANICTRQNAVDASRDARLDRVEALITLSLGRFEALEARADRIESKMDRMIETFDRILQRLPP